MGSCIQASSISQQTYMAKYILIRRVPIFQLATGVQLLCKHDFSVFNCHSNSGNGLQQMMLESDWQREKRTVSRLLQILWRTCLMTLNQLELQSRFSWRLRLYPQPQTCWLHHTGLLVFRILLLTSLLTRQASTSGSCKIVNILHEGMQMRKFRYACSQSGFMNMALWYLTLDWQFNASSPALVNVSKMMPSQEASSGTWAAVCPPCAQEHLLRVFLWGNDHWLRGSMKLKSLPLPASSAL